MPPCTGRKRPDSMRRCACGPIARAFSCKAIWSRMTVRWSVCSTIRPCWRCIASRPATLPDAALPPCRTSPHRPARGWHHGNGRRTFRNQRALCPGGRHLCRRTPLERDQRCEMHDDGSVTLPIRAHNEAECLSWVLGFADRAQVLAPDWLRREIKKTVYADARRQKSPWGSVITCAT